MKTPYMVSPFAQTRHFAHLMQQMIGFRGEVGKGREDRESRISLSQKPAAFNRDLVIHREVVRRTIPEATWAKDYNLLDSKVKLQQGPGEHRTER